MRRLIIYLSGFFGILLLSLYLLGLSGDLSYGIYFLVVGLILIFLVCLPMILFDRYLGNRKIDEIIRKHKRSGTHGIAPSSEAGKKVKGWSMNTSPFRERKSGATWGGGNIHGALPKRNGKKGLFRN